LISSRSFDMATNAPPKSKGEINQWLFLMPPPCFVAPHHEPISPLRRVLPLRLVTIEAHTKVDKRVRYSFRASSVGATTINSLRAFISSACKVAPWCCAKDSLPSKCAIGDGSIMSFIFIVYNFDMMQIYNNFDT